MIIFIKKNKKERSMEEENYYFDILLSKTNNIYEAHEGLIGYIYSDIHELTSDHFYEVYNKDVEDFYMYSTSPTEEDYKNVDKLTELLNRIEDEAFSVTLESIRIACKEYDEI